MMLIKYRFFFSHCTVSEKLRVLYFTSTIYIMHKQVSELQTKWVKVLKTQLILSCKIQINKEIYKINLVQNINRGRSHYHIKIHHVINTSDTYSGSWK